jgi:hypothetical protein
MGEAQMIGCKDVARLLTSGEIDQVGFWGRLPIKLHLWMCRHCSRLASQMKELRVGARKVAGSINKERVGDKSLEERVLGKLDSR